MFANECWTNVLTDLLDDNQIRKIPKSDRIGNNFLSANKSINDDVLRLTGGKKAMNALDSQINHLRANNGKTEDIHQVFGELSDFFGDVRYGETMSTGKNAVDNSRDALSRLDDFVKRVTDRPNLKKFPDQIPFDDVKFEVPYEALLKSNKNKTIVLSHGEQKYTFTTFSKEEIGKVSGNKLTRRYIRVEGDGLDGATIIDGNMLGNKIDAIVVNEAAYRGGENALQSGEQFADLSHWGRQGKILKKALMSELGGDVKKALNGNAEIIQTTMDGLKNMNDKYQKVYNTYKQFVLRNGGFDIKPEIQRRLAEELSDLQKRMEKFYSSAGRDFIIPNIK